MLFNSYEYIFIFLPIVFFAYNYLNGSRLRIIQLLSCNKDIYFSYCSRKITIAVPGDMLRTRKTEIMLI